MVHCNFEAVERVGSLAVDKVVYRISAVHNVNPADADISVFDDSCMGQATAEDCVVVHLAVVDCNSVVEYALRPVETVTMAADCWMKERAGAVRQPVKCHCRSM